MENQENIPKFRMSTPSSRPADVIKGGCNCSKVCDQVKVIKGNQEDRSGNDQYINNYKDIGRAKHFMRNDFAIHLYFFYCIGVQKNMKFLADCFTKDQDPGNLDTTAGTSCTGSYKHKHYQYSS